VNDIKRKIMFSHLLEFSVFGTASAGEKQVREKQKCVSVIFSRSAKIPSFFPSHLLQGQRVRCEILIIYFKDGCNSEIKTP